MQQIELNIFYFIAVFKIYKKTILSLTGAAFVISIIVALLLPVYYESKSTFYPYSPEASDPRNMLDLEKSADDVFSDEDHSERFILIGKSKRIQSYLIEKYNLYTRYGIDLNNPEAKFTMAKEIENNIKLKKGENGAVTVSVFDINRDTAAMMVNDIVNKIENISQEAIRDKNRSVFEAYRGQYNGMEMYISQLKDSLSNVRKKSKNNNLSDAFALSSQVESAMQNFNTMKLKYEQAKTLLQYDLKTIYVVEEAQPPFKKARPQRIIIVGISVLLTFFVSICAFGFVNYIKNQGEVKVS